jgi:PAS domain S-box-containing protein
MKDHEYNRTSEILIEEKPVLKRNKSFILGSFLSLGLLPLIYLLLKKEIARRQRDKKRYELSREYLKEIVNERDFTGMANARLAAIVEHSDDAIISKDLSGRILTWNAGAQRMFGYRPDEMIGKSSRLILPPEQVREEEEIVRLLHQGHLVKNFETVRMNKNGWRIDVAVTTSLLKDENGQVIGVSKIFRDISDKKLVEQILRRDKETLEKLVKDKSEELVAVQMKLERLARLSDIGVLAATVAHELRNPLAAIAMAIANVTRKTKGEESIKNHIRTIEKKIAESEQIINNLLFYSRLRPPQYDAIDLYAFLIEVVDLAEKQTKKEAVFVRNFEGIKGVSIQADPIQIKEVLSNLLLNAQDALIEGKGTVEVKASDSGEFVLIEVIDNGAGIPQEHLERMFEAFFTTKAKGTGLGLTVCRQVVDMHKGKIEAESTVGKGTTMRLFLPKRNPNGQEGPVSR